MTTKYWKMWIASERSVGCRLLKDAGFKYLIIPWNTHVIALTMQTSAPM